MNTINLTDEELILVISSVRHRIKQLALIDIDHDEELRKIQRTEIAQLKILNVEFVKKRMKSRKGEV